MRLGWSFLSSIYKHTGYELSTAQPKGDGALGIGGGRGDGRASGRVALARFAKHSGASSGAARC